MMTMARTVTVSLGPHFEEYINAGIESGKYNNVSEMIRAALRHLEEDEAKMAAFCAAIDEGDASPDVVDFDEEAFIAELKEGGKTAKVRIVRVLHEKMDFPRHL